MLRDFEHLASDTVTDAGGRVVKLIGDEVLFTAPDAGAGCAIALRLAAVYRDHPTIPAARAGLAIGEVMLRDGDVFGPVVNLAARVVAVAGPDEVVVPADLAAEVDAASSSLGPQSLKGFPAPIELCRAPDAAPHRGRLGAPQGLTEGIDERIAAGRASRPRVGHSCDARRRQPHRLARPPIPPRMPRPSPSFPALHRKRSRPARGRRAHGRPPARRPPRADRWEGGSPANEASGSPTPSEAADAPAGRDRSRAAHHPAAAGEVLVLESVSHPASR